jgi:hypothetical protein
VPSPLREATFTHVNVFSGRVFTLDLADKNNDTFFVAVKKVFPYTTDSIPLFLNASLSFSLSLSLSLSLSFYLSLSLSLSFSLSLFICWANFHLL